MKEVERVICWGCGRHIETKKSEGSYKAPFCKPCFKKKFRNHGEYIHWLLNRHIETELSPVQTILLIICIPVFIIVAILLYVAASIDSFLMNHSEHRGLPEYAELEV
jgi:hypothetical protein